MTVGVIISMRVYKYYELQMKKSLKGQEQQEH